MKQKTTLDRPLCGASLDTWLDWRETVKKHGFHVTLETIAKRGGFSISTLKKKSAFRKPAKNDV